MALSSLGLSACQGGHRRHVIHRHHIIRHGSPVRGNHAHRHHVVHHLHHYPRADHCVRRVMHRPHGRHMHIGFGNRGVRVGFGMHFGGHCHRR